ncbi:MAG TPA: adenosylmethionine decarboxylase [Patescibacteria group bacterium]|nr:adenosylmethionine decarboxylase [Patescibacteria group bacterium]
MVKKNKVGTTQFGSHLTLDGYGGDFEKLNDKNIVTRCLEELVEKLGMHKLTEPMVVECGAVNPKDSGGYSGFVMIIESHISVHTFPYRKFVSVDAYTCKGSIDKEFVVDYFKEAFGLEEVEVNYIVRGKKFPAEDIVETPDLSVAKEMNVLNLQTESI